MPPASHTLVLLGLYDTFNALESAIFMVRLVLSSVMLESGCFTVTSQVALLFPQVAVIVAVPGATATTFPSDTEATFPS